MPADRAARKSRAYRAKRRKDVKKSNAYGIQRNHDSV